MFKSAIGHSFDIDSLEAITDVISQCKKELGNLVPGAGILFSALSFDHELVLKEINNAFPGIKLIGCTTDGELSSKIGFTEDSIILTCFYSDSVRFATGVAESISGDSKKSIKIAVDKALGELTNKPSLCLITPESISLDGTGLLLDFAGILGKDIPIFGGSAAVQSQKTYQYHNSRIYSDSLPFLLMEGELIFSFGMATGFKPFGEKHTVNKVNGNIVYEIDGKKATDIYNYYSGGRELYTGEYPLAVFNPDGSFHLRVPYSYNDDGSIKFAASIPLNSTVQIATAERSDIIDGAVQSSRMALKHYAGTAPDLALVVSCVTRRIILGTRVNEEYESIKRILPAETKICGFYAFGETCPTEKNDVSFFHNESIAILLLGTQ